MNIVIKKSVVASTLLFFLIFPVCVSAVDFFTDLESVADQTDPSLTTVVNSNGVSANFTGGTIDFLDIAALYSSGKKSWMVAPLGDSDPPATGVSTGTGVITFSQGATCVSVFGRNEMAGTMAEVRVKDVMGGLIESEVFLTNTNFIEVTKSRILGQELIGSVELVVTSGTSTGMAALDDIAYSTDSQSCGAPASSGGGSSGGSSSSSVDLYLLLMMLVLTVYLRRKGITR